MTEIREERPSDAPPFTRSTHAHLVATGRPTSSTRFGRTTPSRFPWLPFVKTSSSVTHVQSRSVGEATGAGLAPLAVLPEHQRCGIGSDLVRVGKKRLEATGCRFIVVLGHPSFYLRFGFSPAGMYGISCQWNVPDDAFMVAMLSEPAADLKGVAKYRPEFSTVL